MKSNDLISYLLIFLLISQVNAEGNITTTSGALSLFPLSGEVYIGDKLVITEGSGAYWLIANNAYYNSGWKYKSNGQAMNIFLGDTGVFRIGSVASGSEGEPIIWGDSKFVVTNDGNVGIGIHNPTSKLYIKGDSYPVFSAVRTDPRDDVALSSFNLVLETPGAIGENFGPGFDMVAKNGSGTNNRLVALAARTSDANQNNLGELIILTNSGTENPEIRWIIQSDGDLVPAVNKQIDIGESGTCIDNLYVDEIFNCGFSFNGVLGKMVHTTGENEFLASTAIANPVEYETAIDALNGLHLAYEGDTVMKSRLPEMFSVNDEGGMCTGINNDVIVYTSAEAIIELNNKIKMLEEKINALEKNTC